MRHIFDPYILLPVVGLSSFSVFVLSSTAPLLSGAQAVFFAVGIVFFFFFALLDTRIWSGKTVVWVYVFSLLLLALTFFATDIRGASRWIEVGGFQIQPSEFLKPFLIIVWAYLGSKKPPTKFTNLLLSLGSFLPIVTLIFLQPDLGNAIVYTIMYLGILFVLGLPWLYIKIGAFVSLVLLPFSWIFLRDYQKARLVSFLNPYSDPGGAGYNALQAIIAIGSGELMGLGLGRGTQSKLLFLPEYHTDFVFAALIEELGFLGGAMVLVCYSVLLGRLFVVTFALTQRLPKAICMGVLLQIFIQIVINIGMNMGLMPITGITLPLLSYGGSSIISMFISLGVVAAFAGSIRSQPLVIR